MPHMAVVDRGYKGKICQTRAAATRDLMRVGGKAVEGAHVVSGPAVIAEQLPDDQPSKKVAIDFVQKYEKACGAGSRNQFAGHGYDAELVLEKIIPVALKKAKPGLLMLDEPSLGLEPLVVRENFAIITELRNTGVTIVLVEQNARAALAVADYGYGLEMGELSLPGPAPELAEDPRVIDT